MKTKPVCLGFAALLLCCAAAPAAPVSPPVFTVDNHKQIVTVKEGSVLVFSQKLSSPNVTFTQTALGKKSTQISLVDGMGKMLWSKTLSRNFDTVKVHNWDRKRRDLVVVEALTQAYKAYYAKYHSGLYPFHAVYGEALINPQDRVLLSRLDGISGGKRHTMSIARLQDGFSASIDSEQPVVIFKHAPAALAY